MCSWYLVRHCFLHIIRGLQVMNVIFTYTLELMSSTKHWKSEILNSIHINYSNVWQCFDQLTTCDQNGQNKALFVNKNYCGLFIGEFIIKTAHCSQQSTILPNTSEKNICHHSHLPSNIHKF